MKIADEKIIVALINNYTYKPTEMLLRALMTFFFTAFALLLMGQVKKREDTIAGKLSGINSVPTNSHADTLPYVKVIDLNPHSFKAHDTIWFYSGICKTLKTTVLTGNDAAPFLNREYKKQLPLFKIHGNIQYDFTYRSLIDTPFSQKDFSQHTIQTTLDLTIKENLPVRVTILTRQSNSPYFDDITDVSVQFNQRQYLQQVRNNLSRQLPDILNKTKLLEAENLYNQKKWKATALQNWINHPGRLQEIIEAKENEARGRAMAVAGAVTDSLDTGLPEPISAIRQLPTTHFIKKKVFAFAEQQMQKIRDSIRARTDSLVAEKKDKKDSLLNKDLLSEYRKKKEELDHLLKELNTYEGKIKSVKKGLQDSLALLKQQLSGIKDPAQLKNFIRQHKLSAKDLPKGWQALAAINTIGLGRTWVDYSELTVQNISLTGINAELNPGKLYLAFAAGRVNYRFRDFVIKNTERPKQNLYLVRAGIGRKESNHLIFTWYDGKRNLLNITGNAATVSANLERVIGMSVQTRLQVNKNNYVILESAKSSFHNTGTINQPTNGLIDKVWNFKDRSNEAWSIKLFSVWPQSNTRFSGYYRKMGEHFQSFNLQPVNVNQEAYNLRVQQSFWKKRLLVDAGVRKNDFSNPLINPGISSKTIFKSVQVTLRVPKYPFVSIGYYPSSQLTVLDNNIIAENQYNTLSAVASHTYRVKKISMSSNVLFLKFYNSGADTGFIYYNASSWTMNQFVFLKNLQLQTGLTITSQRDLKVRTIEQSASYQAKEWLTLNGGLKYNRVNGEQTLWGATAGLGVLIRKFGTIQAMYDKSYLPGTARNLLPVNMGRVTYYKVF